MSISKFSEKCTQGIKSMIYRKHFLKYNVEISQAVNFILLKIRLMIRVRILKSTSLRTLDNFYLKQTKSYLENQCYFLGLFLGKWDLPAQQ